ncbi:aromatic acid/H+ symport family MFS transporter [Actinomycetospora chlora]|uniref:Aromatic acid/H+ symport family MFS transporter n=1 Tax=Actinomycetospora chlora TaxID=663608 RepID=A0ABP9ANR2_9PSEU
MAAPPETRADTRPQTSARTPRRARPTARGGLAVLICTVVTIMEGYSLIVYGSVVPLLLDDTTLGLTAQTAGVVGGLVYVGMFFGALTAGVVGDRIGRQPVLLVCIAVFGLGLLAAGLAGSGTTLGVARLASGLGVGGAVVTALAIARGHAASHRVGLVVNVTMAGIPIGGTVAALLGIVVMPAFGWRPMFYLGAALTLLILLVAAAVRLERPRDASAAASSAPRTATLRTLFTGRGRLFAVLAAAVAIPNMFTWFGLNVWLVGTMSALQYPLTSALAFSLTLTAGAIIGSLGTAVWADRWGVLRVGAVTAAATVVGLAAVLLVGRSLPVLFAGIFLMGVGGHSTANLLNAAVSNLFPAAVRGTAMGWTNGMSYFGALGPVLGGIVLAGQGPYGVFALYGVSAVVALVVITVFARVAGRAAAPAD